MSVAGLPYAGIHSLRANASLRWYDADESHYVGFKPPTSVTTSIEYTLPPAPPSVSGYALTSTTGGVLSWALASGGSGEVNTGSNLGAGLGVFYQKVGVDLQFSSLNEDPTGGNSINLSFGSGPSINIRARGVVPVGCIVAWLKSATGTGLNTTIDDEFYECNGQQVTDVNSPMYLVTLPDLNGKFLRGSTTSGGTGGTATHTHSLSGGSMCLGSGTDRSIATESHLPPYYEVVWLCRIK